MYSCLGEEDALQLSSTSFKDCKPYNGCL